MNEGVKQRIEKHRNFYRKRCLEHRNITDIGILDLAGNSML